MVCKHFTYTKILILLSALLAFSTKVFPGGITATEKFDRISTQEGLSQSSVNHIIQDKDGFMWFATYDGLNRYDGYRFKVYKNILHDTTSLIESGVNYLMKDKDGFIWAIHSKNSGLSKFNPETEKFIRYRHDTTKPKSISSNKVTNIIQDSRGTIWISTENTIDVYQPRVKYGKVIEEFKHIDINKFESRITKLHENFKGEILLITDYIFRLNTHDFTIDTLSQFLSPENIGYKIISVNEDKQGNLLIGTGIYGNIYLNYDTATGRYIQAKDNPYNVSPNSANYTITDSEDRIWIASNTKGLFLLKKNDQEIIHFTHDKNNPASISENSVNCVFIDRFNVLWIGTATQGICKLDLNKKQFEYYQSGPGKKSLLNSNIVSGIHSTKQNELWVAMDNGGGVNRLITHSDGTVSSISYTHNEKDNNTIAHDNVFCLHQRKNGDVWLGTFNGWLTKIEPEKPEYGTKGKITNRFEISWIFSLYEDSDEILWGGTWGGGLWKMNEETETLDFYTNNPKSSNSLGIEVIWSIFEDNAGNLWIGGQQNGLSILPKEEKNKPEPTFINYHYIENDSNSLSNNNINAIFQDSQGFIWIATLNGLNKVINADTLHSLKFKSFHKEDGLAREGILGITEDNKGHLWMSAYHRIIRYNKQTTQFTNYIVNNEFSRGNCFKDKNGKIYFGGSNGMVAFYPGSIKLDSYAPEVVITDIKLFNKSVEVGEKINSDIILEKSVSKTQKIFLSHKNNVLTIEFAALHYAQPDKNKFAFYMEGFDNKWNYVNQKRDATYTNMDPGEYTFRVKASNYDGLWNETGTALTIVIKPPVWKTWWFRITMFTLILSAIYSIYRIRLAALNKQKKKLSKKVSERTKALRTTNEKLVKTNKKLVHKQQQIEEQSQQLNEVNTLLEERQTHIEEQTEKRKAQAEELAEINQDLTKSNETKNKLFSIVAHDLKNPFSGILGFSDILNRRWEKLDDTKKKKFIGIIHESSIVIFDLLENLLYWSRSQMGKIQYKPEKVLINDIVKESIELLKYPVQQKNNSIHTNLPEALFCYTDIQMIKTIVRNILSNANKFTENGTIKISAIVDEHFVQLSIKDSGVGIAEEKIDSLFELSDTKSTGGTQGEKGTGLGLLLCKEFVTTNGGTIYAESEIDKGTTITFSIPRAK